jgi:hypothetical protein
MDLKPVRATSCRVVLFALADFGIEHVRTREEFGFGRTRHQASDDNTEIFHFCAEREGTP